MNEANIKFSIDTYRGLYCGACGVINAVEKGTLDAFALKWDSTSEKMECHGCKSDHVAEFCNNCKIRNCAIEKGVDFCIECRDFPCETMQAFFENNSAHPKIHFSNLERIKEAGLDVWLTEQKARWSCKACGTKFHFDETTCTQCGEKLYNLVDEANSYKQE
jgi:hypothetical protein